MKNKMILITLCMSLAMFSCEENNIDYSLTQKSFEYEGFSSNLNKIVNCAYFIDDMNGFVAGNGKIFKTVDGGLTWETDSVTNVPFFSIYFINAQVGFAVGGTSSVNGSIIYKTTDAGENWLKQDIPYQGSELHSVFLINENIGFVIGLGLQAKTINGGKNWEKFEFAYKGLMKKISFINSQLGFCAGLYGNIFKTVNQGENWIETNNESDGHVYDFCFVNEKIGYAGGQKEIVKTTDGGETWKILKDSPSEIYFLHFANENDGIAIGKGHYTGGDWGKWTSAIYRTNNGGITWEMEDDIDFGSVASFFDKNDGYSVTLNKTFKISYK